MIFDEWVIREITRAQRTARNFVYLLRTNAISRYNELKGHIYKNDFDIEAAVAKDAITKKKIVFRVITRA